MQKPAAKKRLSLFLLLSLFFTHVTPQNLWAETDRFSVHFPKIVFDDGDFITTFGSNNLPAKGWRFSTNLMYEYHPLEITSGGTVTGRVINQMFVQHFDAAFAPTSWWQLEADLPMTWYNQFKDPTIPLPTTETHPIDIGDLQIRQKFTFLRRDQHNIGFALMPYINIPIGNENHFMGDSRVTGGASFSLDGNPSSRISLGLNVDFKIQEYVHFFDLEAESLLGISGAIATKISKHFGIKADIYTSTPFSDLFNNKENTPLEALLAAHYEMGETGLRLDLGGGASLIRAAGVPLFRGFLNLGYQGQFKSEPKPEPVPPPAAREEEPLLHIVYFEYDSATLTEGSKQVLDKVLTMIHGTESLELVILTGHTDARGTEEYNLNLSRERAEAVADYLIAHDIKETKIKIQAMGEEKPIAPNDTPEGMSKNRRVEIQIMN